jgi:hypothetical protein
MSFFDDPYAKYADFEGPTPHEEWEAHRRNRGHSVDSNVQGSGGLRRKTPRGGKYAHGSVEGVRIR